MLKNLSLWLGAMLFLMYSFSGLAAIQAAPVPATPTIDRLAPPPTVPVPNQADEGAQLFWLHCQPCHGDRGQGLTDEWRAQYPPEDRNCWESGCHGPRPYENGFVLPESVPALIGPNTLSRFPTAASLYGYTRVAMPYEFPGTLSDAEYLAITAFLARAHDAWDGSPLTDDNVMQFALHPSENPATTPTSTPAPPQNDPSPPPPSPIPRLIPFALLALLTVAGIIWTRARRTRHGVT